MKGLLKNLGLIFIFAGVILLVITACAGAISDNVMLGISAALIVAGLVSYILINKFITDRLL